MSAGLPHQPRGNDRVVNVVGNNVNSVSRSGPAFDLIEAARRRCGLIHLERISGSKSHVVGVAARVCHIGYFSHHGRAGSTVANADRDLKLDQIAGCKSHNRIVDRLRRQQREWDDASVRQRVGQREMDDCAGGDSQVVTAEQENSVGIDHRDYIGGACGGIECGTELGSRHESIKIGYGNAADDLGRIRHGTAVDVALRRLIASIDGNRNAISRGEGNLNVIAHARARHADVFGQHRGGRAKVLLHLRSLGNQPCAGHGFAEH